MIWLSMFHLILLNQFSVTVLRRAIHE